MANELQRAEVVNALESFDQFSEDLVDQVITCTEAALDDTVSDITLDDLGDDATTAEYNNAGYIDAMGMQGRIDGTSGVAVLEYVKDALSTAVSNTSGVATQQSTMRELAERKLSMQ